MNFEKLFAICSLVIQTISFIVVYKKVCDINIKKLNISFILLCLGLTFSSLILAQFYISVPIYGDILSIIFHYLLLFIQPFIFFLYFSKKGLYKEYIALLSIDLLGIWPNSL